MKKALKDHWAIAVILCSALLIRLHGLGQGGLWYDELQSVTFAGLSALDVLKSITVFDPVLVDPHPPFYYLQLHFWMKMGASEWFTLLNSVLWSMLAIVSIYFTVRKVYSQQVAPWASAIFAVLPYSVSYAQEARMYSMMMMLTVWIWYFNYQFLLKSSRIHLLAGLLVSTILFLYGHGSAFLILPGVYCFCLITVWDHKVDAALRNKWIAAQALLLGLYGFWLVKAYKIRFVGSQDSLSSDAVLGALWKICFGFASFESQWLKSALLALVGAALLYVMIKAKKYFAFIFSFIVVPVAACLVVSALFASIVSYKSLYCIVPPLSIGLAVFIADNFDTDLRLPHFVHWMRSLVSLLLVTAFLTFLVLQQLEPRKGFMWPQELVGHLRGKVRDRDVVFTPHNRFYWGLSWYLCGHGSLKSIYDATMVCKVGEARIIVATAPFDPGYFAPGQEVWVTGPRDMSYLDGYQVIEEGRFDIVNLRKIKIPPAMRQ